MDSQMAAGV